MYQLLKNHEMERDMGGLETIVLNLDHEREDLERMDKQLVKLLDADQNQPFAPLNGPPEGDLVSTCVLKVTKRPLHMFASSCTDGGNRHVAQLPIILYQHQQQNQIEHVKEDAVKNTKSTGTDKKVLTN